ncbi:MAG: D-alanyl-D-alanine carboxypeptidase family protein [Albidovulum sp.]
MPAAAFDTSAASAWVYDVKTDTVLLEKNAETPIHPASMSKLMTVFMLFEALRDGRVALDERFSVSSRARAMTGSTMFLNEADRPTAEDLIRGIVVLSGNDACVVVAEGLAGTEAEFARKMNERAKQLGLHSSHFTNSTGWPDPDHLMSAADLGTLATRLIRDFPEYYKYFSLTEFPYDGRSPANRFNRNPLLKLGIGADGLKTGHTQEAGYGLVGSAKQGDRRVVFVIAGMSSEKQRAEEAERVVNWAFREFVQKTVVKKGSKVADAAVWMGDAESVGLVVEEDLSLLLPSLVQDKLAANIRYTGPIEAPVSAGTKLAEMIVDIPGHAAVTVPLVAESDVAKSGFKKRLGIAFGILSTRLAAELGG